MNSGALEKSLGRSVGEVKLEGNVEGLYNPLAWDNMPSSLREAFPHWKEASKFSQSGQKDGAGELCRYQSNVALSSQTDQSQFVFCLLTYLLPFASFSPHLPGLLIRCTEVLVSSFH